MTCFNASWLFAFWSLASSLKESVNSSAVSKPTSDSINKSSRSSKKFSSTVLNLAKNAFRRAPKE